MSLRVYIRGGKQVVPQGSVCIPPGNGARDREWIIKRDYNSYRDWNETRKKRRQRWLSEVRQSVLLVNLLLWKTWLVGFLGIPDATGGWDNSIIGRKLRGKDLYTNWRLGHSRWCAKELSIRRGIWIWRRGEVEICC